MFIRKEAAMMAGKLRKLLALIALGLLVAPVLAACSSGPAMINVTEATYSLALDKDSAKAGTITFHVTNNATDQPHEFVIFQTDLPADSLPLNSDGDVDEEGEGVNHIDEVEDIQPGESKDLTVDLQPGHYALICNMPGHYTQGMHVDFTVK
jgi:uncharacterized cupredoxin-like copper-binding protein